MLPEVTSFMCVLYWIKSLRSYITHNDSFSICVHPFPLLMSSSTWLRNFIILLKTLVSFDFIHSYSSLNTAQIFQTHYLEFVSVNEYWLKMYFIDYFALLWCISVPFCSVYNFTESRTTLWDLLFIHPLIFPSEFILLPKEINPSTFCNHCALFLLPLSCCECETLCDLLTYILTHLLIYLHTHSLHGAESCFRS